MNATIEPVFETALNAPLLAAANVSIVGSNQQAIGARFVRAAAENPKQKESIV
jgi:hypothetical protein